ncbi:hypothetical protein FRB90_003981 [Tulasnella sp. 427]|nr:hypothetical protein FRB90_003981 [Tulasnella sp. 427]
MIDPVIAKGPSASNYAIEHTKNSPVGSYGPWLAALMGLTVVMVRSATGSTVFPTLDIGTDPAFFLKGIISSQAIRYFSIWGFESKELFAVVVVSLVLILMQWIILIHVSWIWFVVEFGNYRAFAEVLWQAWFAPVLGQITLFTAQLFFTYRCYTLYHRNKLVVSGILFGMLASLTLFIMVGVTLATDSSNYVLERNLTIPACCLNLITDLTIAGLMLWKLGLEGGQSFSPNTNDVLQRLRNLTIEAAVPPTVFAALTMIVYLASAQKNLAYTTFGIMTPALYVSSMMFTLNARHSIRKRFNSPNDPMSLEPGYEMSNVFAGDGNARQTESRRTTIVFAARSGPTFAPNASIGIVSERAERHEERPRLDERVSGDDDEDDEPTTPGASYKELQVDLDRWEVASIQQHPTGSDTFKTANSQTEPHRRSSSHSSPAPVSATKRKREPRPDNSSSNHAHAYKDSKKHKENKPASPSHTGNLSQLRQRDSKNRSPSGRERHSDASTSAQAHAPRFQYAFSFSTSETAAPSPLPPSRGQFSFQCFSFAQTQRLPFNAQQPAPSASQSRFTPSTRSHSNPCKQRPAASPTKPKSADDLSPSWATYCAKWDLIEKSCPADIEVKQIPWPLFGAPARQLLPPLNVVNDKSVGSFLYSPKHSSEARKKIIRDALRYYHPDHFEQKVVSRIRREDEGLKEGVRDLGQAVARCLTALLENPGKPVSYSSTSNR